MEGLGGFLWACDFTADDVCDECFRHIGDEVAYSGYERLTATLVVRLCEDCYEEAIQDDLQQVRE